MKMYWKNKYFWLSGAFNIRSFLDANLVPTWLHFGSKHLPKSRLGADLGADLGLLERLKSVLGSHGPPFSAFPPLSLRFCSASAPLLLRFCSASKYVRGQASTSAETRTAAARCRAGTWATSPRSSSAPRAPRSRPSPAAGRRCVVGYISGAYLGLPTQEC